MNSTLERTPDGRRLVVSHPIDAPVETAWEVLTDTRRWPEWGPSVAAVECRDRFIHAGSRGHIRTPGPGVLVGDGRGRGGLRVPFHVTGFEKYRWTWAVAGIPATGHRIEPRGENCRAAIEIPPLAAAYAPVCRRALQAIERVALESGE